MDYNYKTKKYVKEEIDELYDLINYYLENGIEVADRDKNMRFSLLDYYCLTDVNHNDMLAYAIKRNSFTSTNTRITNFFRTIMAGVILDKQQILENKYKFINKDGEFSCNEKMCDYLLEQFEIHGVPLKSNLICEAFYRTCRGEPIFPLADSSKDLPKRRIKCNNK